jgi:hypothetical protein
MSGPLAVTRRWVEEMVIGLDLCPFARRPFEQGTIVYQVAESHDPEAIHRELLQALADFALADPQEQETMLFIVSKGLESFDDYLDLLETARAALAESGLEAMLQLASFHPRYLFERAGEKDPANYTNRSPCPMFHFIRQDGLAAALENYPDPEGIPERNMARLRQMGFQVLQEKLARIGTC